MCKCNNIQKECSCSCSELIPIPHLPIVDLKTVALLELSGTSIDGNLKLTFEYYFNNNKEQFKSFPIVDTEGKIERTIHYLNLYYGLGYRIFIGFNRSSILLAVKPWFDLHPKAIGISPSSTSPTLNIPKNIYRISPSDDNILSNIRLSEYFLSRRKIFYVYSKGELSTETVLALLLNPLSPVKDKIVPIGILPDSSNINDVQTTYLANNYNPLLDATTLYLFVGSQRNNFINLFTPVFIPLPTFDISLSSFPTFTGAQQLIWNNLYFSYQNINLSTSPLWRIGYETLKNLYSVRGLNTLQLNNFLKTRKSLEELSNYAFVQQFNENKDTEYFSYSGFNYKDNDWKPASVFVKDPIFGTFYEALL